MAKGKYISNLAGFGALYYGWKHNADGTAIATKWITALWLPIIPLRRYKLRVLTDFRKDNTRIKLTPFGLVFIETNNFQFYDRWPISLKEVMLTLSKAYIGLPLILIGPIIMLYGILMLLRYYSLSRELNTTVVVTFFSVFIFVALLNFLWQCVKAIRITRGWKPPLEDQINLGKASSGTFST